MIYKLVAKFHANISVLDEKKSKKKKKKTAYFDRRQVGRDSWWVTGRSQEVTAAIICSVRGRNQTHTQLQNCFKQSRTEQPRFNGFCLQMQKKECHQRAVQSPGRSSSRGYEFRQACRGNTDSVLPRIDGGPWTAWFFFCGENRKTTFGYRRHGRTPPWGWNVSGRREARCRQRVATS
jgi:hypothetical protein